MDAELHGDREQDRRGDEHDGGRLHHIAGDQEQDVHDQQELDPGHAGTRDPARHGLRNLLVRHQEREQHCVGDDVEDHRAHVGGAEQHLRHVAERHVLVHEHRDDEGIDRADRRGFGGREQAGVDAAEYDHDQKETPDRLAECREGLAPGCSRHTRIVVLPCAIERGQAKHRGEDQARNNACHEQLPDRGREHPLAVRPERDAAAGRDREDHHHDRRRNEDAERAGGGDDARAEALRKALLYHRGHDDCADGDHSRGRGA